MPGYKVGVRLADCLKTLGAPPLSLTSSDISSWLEHLLYPFA